MKYIVIFGGAFNPVHMGHIKIAQAAANAENVERVLVIPSNISPHKSSAHLLPAVHRFEMCRLAFKGSTKITVSDMELQRHGKSYTYDTLKQVKLLYPEHTIKLLVGADMLVTLESWYKFEEIIKTAEILAAARPGILNSKMRSAISWLENRGAIIKILNVPECDISSTQIRKKIAKGEDVCGYLPIEVINYINQNNLYKNGE